MIRKYVLALSILALPLGMVAFSTTAANASVRPHTTVTMTGKVSCKIAGKITSSPGLLLTTARKVKITLSVTASGCTGHTSQGGAVVKSGAVSGTISGKYSCESLLSSVPNPSGTIKWTSSTKTDIAATDFTLSGGKVVSTSPPTITYSSKQTGSYAGTGKSKAVVSQSENQLITACESSSGLTSLTIKSGTIS